MKITHFAEEKTIQIQNTRSHFLDFNQNNSYERKRNYES